MLFGDLREGMFYLGLPVPPGNGTLSQDHGELMVLGFRRRPPQAPAGSRSSPERPGKSARRSSAAAA